LKIYKKSGKLKSGKNYQLVSTEGKHILKGKITFTDICIEEIESTKFEVTISTANGRVKDMLVEDDCTFGVLKKRNKEMVKNLEKRSHLKF